MRHINKGKGFIINGNSKDYLVDRVNFLKAAKRYAIKHNEDIKWCVYDKKECATYYNINKEGKVTKCISYYKIYNIIDSFRDIIKSYIERREYFKSKLNEEYESSSTDTVFMNLIDDTALKQTIYSTKHLIPIDNR